MRGVGRGFRFAAFWLLLSGCREASAPPGRVSVPRPLELVPSDLDVVFRVDPERFRRAFPELAPSGVVAPSLEPNVVWSRASLVASSLVLGLRWSSEFVPLDGVLVATGVTPDEFETVVPRALFHAAVDLGRGWYRYDARSCERRMNVCRVYYGVSEVFVAASLAELDAVERTLENGATGSRLEPESGGALGVAMNARGLRGLVAEDASKAATFLGRARGLRAKVDLIGGKVLLDVESEWDSDERAERATDAFGLYVELLRRTRLPAEVEIEAPKAHGARVTVKIAIRREALAFR